MEEVCLELKLDDTNEYTSAGYSHGGLMASNLAIFDQGNFMAGAALINSAGPCATGNYGLYCVDS